MFEITRIVISVTRTVISVTRTIISITRIVTSIIRIIISFYVQICRLDFGTRTKCYDFTIAERLNYI
jgi:hypothetical protein